MFNNCAVEHGSVTSTAGCSRGRCHDTILQTLLDPVQQLKVIFGALWPTAWLTEYRRTRAAGLMYVQSFPFGDSACVHILLPA